MNSTGERSASESVAQREEIAQAVIEHPHMRVDGLAEHGRKPRHVLRVAAVGNMSPAKVLVFWCHSTQDEHLRRWSGFDMDS